MFLLFYVDGCLIFISSKGKMVELYASLQLYLKIEDDRELNKYLGIELYRLPDGSINLSQTYLTQRIINIIPGMYSSSVKPTPAIKPPLAKKQEAQPIKMTLIIDK